MPVLVEGSGQILAGHCRTQVAIELEEILTLDEPFEITATGFEMARIDALIEDLHKPALLP